MLRQTAGYLRVFEKNNKLPNNEMIGPVGTAATIVQSFSLWLVHGMETKDEHRKINRLNPWIGWTGGRRWLDMLHDGSPFIDCSEPGDWY